MKKRKIGNLLMVLCLMFTLFVTACSSSDNTANETENKPESGVSDTNNTGTSEEEGPKEPTKQFSDEPVTLKIATTWDLNYFTPRMIDPIQEQFPNVTVEYVNWNGTVENMQELSAQGIVPDIVHGSTGQAPLEELEMVFGLDEMIEEYGVDVSGVNPELLQELRSRDKEGRLIGLPDAGDVLALYYNKEIFDLFGVSYPTDNITWDELLDLAKQLTVMKDGVQYSGLDLGYMPTAIFNQLSMNYTDPETGEVLFDKDPKFAKMMEVLTKYFSIPNIYNPEDQGKFEGKTAAMVVNWHGFLTWFGGETEERVEYEKSMDMVPVPSFADMAGIAPKPGTHPWVINDFSENKEAALQVLSYLISPDYQLQYRMRMGTPSVSLSQEDGELFGADDPTYTDKNVSAMFQNTFAEPPARKSPWDQYVAINEALTKFATSDLNVAEFTRVLKEETDIKIKEEKSKQ
ncbi:extracellular solute-binding protein [Paenibacillus sp. Marseille-Q4541]|uniref:ABC transporter substrate-binding protein n=1 Tax=Paenibacillus sp. Marseille-Q4541 TaxID=2831522 RepID=UPI001BA486C3|nr:extracellular solute-binding protein [Paenibacillus sp. Marseille-Q4541]